MSEDDRREQPDQTAVDDEAARPEDYIERLEAQSFAESSPGARGDLNQFWRSIVFGLGLVMSLFHLYTAAFGTLPSQQQRTFHLGFGLGLIFLLYPANTEMTSAQRLRGWVLTAIGLAALGFLVLTEQTGFYTVLPAAGVLLLVQAARHLPHSLAGMPVADLLLSLLAFGSGAYMFLNAQEIIRRAGIHNEVDLAIGTVGVLLVLVAVQRVVGTPLTVVASGALLYAYFGPYMPGFLSHRGYSVDRIISTSFLTTEGVFGTPIAISSTFIFMFMVFAALLQRTGMERFFTQLAFGATGWMTGGTAKVGVLTSAFSGTITGSSVANTVSNGAFTIPMMKKAGYKPQFAGAVEAASSTGGQLAPPIMGAAAFIMIDFTGIPYIEIIQAAAVPALLFFAAQFVVVHYDSKRLGIMGLPRDRLPHLGRLLATRGYLLVPIVVIFAILASGRTPIRAALLAIVAAVLVNIVAQIVAALMGRWRDLDDRLNLTGLINGLVDAARIALPIIAACAAAGIIAGVITLTGIGLQLSSGLLSLARDTLILTMVFSMIACIVLGIGLPTTANYVITATLAAPALLAFDAVPVIAAHMFVYYFGIMADITPPVALASYAASGIAQANPIRTSFNSVRIALGGFLVPYMFVLSPQLLLVDVTPLGAMLAVATAFVGIYAVSTGVVGYINRPLHPLERAALFGSGLALIYGEPTSDLIGFAVFFGIYAWQLRKTDGGVRLRNGGKEAAGKA